MNDTISIISSVIFLGPFRQQPTIYLNFQLNKSVQG